MKINRISNIFGFIYLIVLIIVFFLLWFVIIPLIQGDEYTCTYEVYNGGRYIEDVTYIRHSRTSKYQACFSYGQSRGGTYYKRKR